jgi:nitrite reductase/ring-hydroxylating ferredoxin subunit
MAFTRVAIVSEVPAGKGIQVKVAGKTIALFNTGEAFFAIDDTCTHRGAPLSEGECAGGEVVCPWHGARFDLASGEVKTPPASKGVSAYKVQVAGEEIQIDI